MFADAFLRRLHQASEQFVDAAVFFVKRGAKAVALFDQVLGETLVLLRWFVALLWLALHGGLLRQGDFF